MREAVKKLVAKEVTELLEKHNLKEKGYVFQWNNRKASFGLFKRREKKIELSAYLFDQLSETQVRDTILHEIAHALVYEHFERKGQNVKPHGKEWKETARSIGCSAERTGPEVIREKKGSIVYECLSCKKRIYRHRRLKGEFACYDCRQRRKIDSSACRLILVS